jgi:hypothetical protein
MQITTNPNSAKITNAQISSLSEKQLLEALREKIYNADTQTIDPSGISFLCKVLNVCDEEITHMLKPKNAYFEEWSPEQLEKSKEKISNSLEAINDTKSSVFQGFNNLIDAAYN